MPRHDVKRSMILTICEKLSVEFGKDFPLQLRVNDAMIFMICSLRCEEISFVCQSISANRSKVRNHEMSFKDFANPATMMLSLNIWVNCELDPAWNNNDLFRSNKKLAQLSRDLESA